jgi:hypothetical protein
MTRHAGAVALATAAAIGFVLISRSGTRGRREEGGDPAFELWMQLQPDGSPPQPSVFAAWRGGYGDRSLLRAIRDVAKQNELSAQLVDRVLLIRAQFAHLHVEEILARRESGREERRWLGAA